MQTDQAEIERRKQVAISKFVAHHLEEIEKNFWQKYLGTTDPDPKQVLDILVWWLLK